MIYITYNELPSGVYYSQVINVCSFIKNELKTNIRLVAFISIRGYWKNRKKIKNKLSGAIVIPMIPKHSNWKWNIVLLKLILLILGKQKAICRGIFVTNMALALRKRGNIPNVVFDARGAYKAEFEEYLHKVVHLKDSIEALEKRAVFDSDFRLAVSQKLVGYWKQEYGYIGNNHVIIPCTLDNNLPILPSKDYILSQKQKLGYSAADIIIIYAGSNADWQSVKYIDAFILKHLENQEHLKIILLSKFEDSEVASLQKFPNRITQKWVNPNEVHQYLSIADYGLLIREPSMTNEVASPTKFAEYLNAGLKIIASSSIGDFSEFIKKHDSGFVYESAEILTLIKVENIERQRMNLLANQYFTKKAYIKEYKSIVGLI